MVPPSSLFELTSSPQSKIGAFLSLRPPLVFPPPIKDWGDQRMGSVFLPSPSPLLPQSLIVSASSIFVPQSLIGSFLSLRPPLVGSFLQSKKGAEQKRGRAGKDGGQRGRGGEGQASPTHKVGSFYLPTKWGGQSKKDPTSGGRRDKKDPIKDWALFFSPLCGVFFAKQKRANAKTGGIGEPYRGGGPKGKAIIIGHNQRLWRGRWRRGRWRRGRWRRGRWRRGRWRRGRWRRVLT